MAKILLVEDDADLALTVADVLEWENFRVESLADGEEASRYLETFDYDLIILDVDLPRMSGIEICRRFRAREGKTPVIMLTGRSTMADKSSGFQAGADDYLTKPFLMEELILRIKALLNRASNMSGSILKACDLELEPEKKRVFKGGMQIKLSPIEFAVLEFLLRNRGKVYSGESLLNAVWPADSERTPDTVRTCIKRLRERIDSKGEPSVIKNVHGSGYCIE